MNANALITENMTLDEKLAVIDNALKAAQEVQNEERTRAGLPIIPIDPAALTICDGCE